MLRVLLALLFLRCALGAAPREIVICTYNVQNYVDSKPPGPDSKFGTKEKTEKSIEALIAIIKSVNPDVLGVCEMGSPARFEDFKKRLADAGLGYVDSEYVAGPDPDRHLALVSRFPIVARQSLTDIPFEIGGQPEKVRRGFLDVTIEVNSGYRLRMVGVHLKSKLAAPEGEALIRRYEAQALRRHLETILTADPTTNLACYGDFNDTKNQPVFSEITSVRGTPMHMSDLWAKDALGDRWTYHWKTSDEYSRIDYLFVSPALVPEVVKSKSQVYRGDDWSEASDHRPVSATIVPVNRK